ncbi:hypothetical protein D3C78_1140820 [compost metagenome]
MRLLFSFEAMVPFSSMSSPALEALASRSMPGSTSTIFSPFFGCSQAFSSGSVMMMTRLVISMGTEKMVSDSGMVPICLAVGWPGVATSTGILADKPRPYIVKPL